MALPHQKQSLRYLSKSPGFTGFADAYPAAIMYPRKKDIQKQL